LDIPLTVNGTLMRGLELNPRMIAVGARFLRETTEGQLEITTYGGWRAYISSRIGAPA
jgi:hypothetical protein